MGLTLVIHGLVICLVSVERMVLTCLLAHSPVKLSAWTPRLTAHSVISAWCGTMTATTHDLRLSP